MPTQTLAPDAIVASTNLSGAVTDIDEPITPYVVYPVSFDGTNDYLTGSLANAADSKLLTISFWARKTVAGTDQILLRGTSVNRPLVYFTTGNRFRILILSSAGASGLDIFTATTFSTTWRHVVASVNMANQAGSKIYVDDSADTFTVNQFNDVDLALSSTNYGVGAQPGGTQKYSGDLADPQIWFGKYIDLTVEANRRLFIKADGTPEDPVVAVASSLGDPIILLSGPTATWRINRGTGGGLTENGGLTDGSSPVAI